MERDEKKENPLNSGSMQHGLRYYWKIFLMANTLRLKKFMLMVFCVTFAIVV